MAEAEWKELFSVAINDKPGYEATQGIFVDNVRNQTPYLKLPLDHSVISGIAEYLLGECNKALRDTSFMMKKLHSLMVVQLWLTSIDCARLCFHW
jgi:hypothetical protein